MSRRKSVLVVDEHGGLFVEAGAVMTPLVALIDGLHVVFFGKSKKMYLRVDDAIGWCRKEMGHHSREKYEQIVAVLERFKKQEAQPGAAT